MEWKNVPKNIEDYQGYIYKITNLKTNQYYIGKKNFWRIEKKKPLKGKKNKRHFKKETDWKKYYGSCNILHDDIAKYGEDNFERVMIEYCESKFKLSYMELWWQMEYDVMHDSDSYNGILNVRLRKPKEYWKVNK